MKRLFPGRLAMAVAGIAILAAALVVSCGGGSELGSVGSLLDVVPRGADSFMSAQVEDLRDEGLDDLVDELAEMVDSDRLEDWEIDFDDITSLVISEPGGRDSLTVLRGFLSVEDAEEALDDDGFRDDTFQETDIWSRRGGGMAVAFLAEDVLVIGEEKNVEKSIDAVKGDGRSLRDDKDFQDILDEVESALFYSIGKDCEYRGCRTTATAVRLKDADLMGVTVFNFRDEDTASDAVRDIKRSLDDLLYDLELSEDGPLVVVTAEFDERALILDRKGLLFGSSGKKSRMVRASPQALRAAAVPQATLAPAPVRQPTARPQPTAPPAVAATIAPTARPQPTAPPAVVATAAPTARPQPTAPPAVVATAAPTARPEPTIPPEVAKPEQYGTVTVSTRNLRNGSGTPRFCFAGCSETIYQLAITETLTGVEAGPRGVLDPRNTPRLAESWEVSPDFSYMVFHLRQGVPFHKDWGEMTAEDVAFSYNDANAYTNPESIHGQAGDFAPLISEVEALDRYTVRFNFNMFHQAMPLRYMSPFYQSAGIVSKSVYDQYGREGMRDIIIGTGPFVFEDWKRSERLTATSVTEHWRKVPAIRDIRIFDIPEAAVRVAILETGEAQISGELPFRDIARLQNNGFKLQRGSGLAHERGVFFSGNYWETEHPITGRPLVRPREQKPWIGFIDDPGSMERARLVRWAMSMAVDREELKEVLTEGVGAVCFLNQISIHQPGWQDKWEVYYDPDRAKQFMADAGYPDGFEAELWVGPGGFTAELGDAVARMWAEYLNISTIVDRITYTKFRPTLVHRTNTQIYASAGDEGKAGFPVHWPKGFQGSAFTDGGWGPGFEDPFYTENLFKMNSEADPDKRMTMAEEYFDHVRHWMVQPCFVEVPFHPMYNTDLILEWTMYPNMNINLSGSSNFETIGLK